VVILNKLGLLLTLLSIIALTSCSTKRELRGYEVPVNDISDKGRNNTYDRYCMRVPENYIVSTNGKLDYIDISAVTEQGIYKLNTKDVSNKEMRELGERSYINLYQDDKGVVYVEVRWAIE